MTNLDTAPDVDAPAPRLARERHPAAIRWMHWINFPLLFVMVYSGLRIYWANDEYAFGFLGWEWFHFFPEWVYDRLQLNQRLARGLAFHFTFGWLFVANGLAYIGYLVVSGEWRHVVPDRRGIKDIAGVVAHDLRLRKTAPPQGRYNAAQQAAYSLVIALGGVIVLSGFAIYKPTQLSLLTRLLGGYETARLIHFSATIAFLVFFVVHVAQVVRAGWKNFATMITGFELDPATDPDPTNDPDPASDGGGGDRADGDTTTSAERTAATSTEEVQS